ncbi:nitroreductase family protein [Halogeometricum borinquense]|uniref:Nitroreductase family protein n=1 Tax=Halogeometricum borinquense TaxID=60847 RepID=A0A6C0ULR7_9EURY|nr:nitroreductase family protein [Halogeometricum borinquense]QIB75301.1 nitroreductase family protein [Halogeometricum borinquense]QIQ75754.1 nitroreductase family protein [Halogeometricum borinquense]
MEYDEVVTSRRSVHQYADEDLPTEIIESIFERVRHAPSSYNLQPWEFLVLTDDEKRQQLREVAYDQEHVTEAPVAVVVLGNKDPSAHADAVLDDWLAKGYLPNEDARDTVLGNIEGMADLPEAERRVWAVRSTTIAATELMNAAWEEGVASCPMGGFDPEGVLDTFDIDGDQYEPVMLVTLGYPDDEAADVENERKYRRPVDEIVHYDEFDPVESTELPAEIADAVPTPSDD